MNRRWGRLIVGVTMIAIGLAQSAAQASTPSSGTIDVSHRALTWTGGPLFGSAPATKRYFCASPATCDDFVLTVNLPAAAFPGAIPRLTLSITSSSPNQFQILTYAPGSDPAVTNSDYTVYTGDANILNPKAGAWHIKAACYVCANASYTMKASADSVLPAKALFNPFSLVTLPGLTKTTVEGAGEPGLTIGPKGELWINAPGAAADFWGSYDGGKNYTLYQPDISPTSGDTWLTIGAGGEVYADNLSHAGGTNLLYVTKDGGKTWINTSTPIGNVPYLVGTDSDRQWITADPKIPGTIYFESHDLGDNGILVSKSTNYGQTWTLLASITLQEITGHSTTDSLGGNTTGPISFSPDGKTMVFSVQTDVLADGLTALPTRTDFDLTKQYAVTSTDGGANWKFNLIADRKNKAYVGHLLGGAIVFDKAGTMYFTWSERPYTDTITNVVFSRSTDGAKTWSVPTLVSDNGASNVFTAIAAGGDPGHVDIAWLESSAKDFNDTTATWRVVMAQSDNALSATPAWTKMQVSKGIMHAADICQAGTLCAATMGNRNLADYIWMQVDSTGMAHIAYADDASGTLLTVVANQVGGAGTIAGAGSTTLPPINLPPLPKVAAARLPATGSRVNTAAIGVVACGLALVAWPTRRRRRR